MAPQIHMKNRLLPSSSDHIALGAGMNTNEGKVPGTLLCRHEEDTALNEGDRV